MNFLRNFLSARTLFTFNPRNIILSFVALASFTVTSQLYAAGTPANSLVQNQASVDFSVAGIPTNEVSNIDSFFVAELIELTLVSNDLAGVTVQSPSTDKALSYTLTNQGNGAETFNLSFVQSVADQFNTGNVRIYLDANTNGIFDLALDTLYVFGVNDPLLAADATLDVFLVSDIPGARVNGDLALIDLTAASLTGTGLPGTFLAGLGEGGSDAVLGSNGGDLSTQNNYVIGDSIAIAKSQLILDPLGGSAPIQNAIITYTLTMTATGTGTFTGVDIVDVIPANAAYVPGSLTFNALPLTDAVDVDAGVFNGLGIQVILGAVVAPDTQTVTFQARIL